MFTVDAPARPGERGPHAGHQALGGRVLWVSGPAGLMQGVHHAHNLLPPDTNSIDAECGHQRRDGQAHGEPKQLTSAWKIKI